MMKKRRKVKSVSLLSFVSLTTAQLVFSNVLVSDALHQSIASFASTKQPYLCRLVLLQVAESLDSRFSIKMGASYVCDKMWQPRLFASIDAAEPATDSFRASLVKFYLKRRPDANLVAECLSKGSSLMKIAALEFVLQHNEILNFTEILNEAGVKRLILNLCQDSMLSVTVRLPALELLGRGLVNISSSDWTVPAILEAYGKTRVPAMRNVLLIIMARTLANGLNVRSNGHALVVWQEAFLNEVDAASTEEQVSYLND